MNAAKRRLIFERFRDANAHPQTELIFANAFELRQALEDKGVPVKLVVYDGFGHPINKPRQQRAVMAENAAWFFHYIWGEALPAALTPPAAAASTPADSKGP